MRGGVGGRRRRGGIERGGWRKEELRGDEDGGSLTERKRRERERERIKKGETIIKGQLR